MPIKGNPFLKPHYNTSKRTKFSGEQTKLFVELFHDKKLRRLAQLHYVEGYSLLECSEKMNYSYRHIERMHSLLKDVAIEELMYLVGLKDSGAMKILQIKNIVCQGGI